MRKFNMIPIAQHIRVKTKDRSSGLSVLIVEESKDNFSVLMAASAFPAGTSFSTAEQAVAAARDAINKVLAPDKIIEMSSDPKEEFITNQRLASLI